MIADKKLIRKDLSFKSRLLKRLTTKKFLLTLAIIFGLIIFEFSTDFVEVVVGNILELTNPLRPKSGTIWDLYHKDSIASDQLQEMTKSISDRQIENPTINDLDELKATLDEKQTVTIPGDQFLNLYNQFPPRTAYEIISPFDLLKLAHSRTWIWTKIVKDENSLNFYYLDGEKQLLMDTYPPQSILYEIPQSDNTHQASLDSMANFNGRSFSKDQFFAAFDDLSNSVKFQIINNPFLLVKWDRTIKKVAVSRYAVDNIVSIGFEVNNGIYTEVYTFEASEWAVDYLIERLNELYPELNLESPERKESEISNFD